MSQVDYEKPLKSVCILTSDSNSSILKENKISEEMFDENEILNRLNNLRKWQEEQRLMLVENQLDQQKMLQLEKQKIYDLFGLHLPYDETTSELDDKNNSFDPHESLHNRSDKHVITPTGHLKSNDCKKIESSSTPIQQIIKSFSDRKTELEYEKNKCNIENVKKRPFLKRGDGLKARFKIAPDTFRLNNLPKYKFSRENQKHAQNLDVPTKKRHQRAKTNDAKTLFDVDITYKPISGDCHNNTKKNKQTNNLSQTKNTALNTQEQTTSYSNSKNAFRNIHHSSTSESEDALENEIITRTNLPHFQNNLSTPVGKYLLDTPTRKQVQQQQDELNDLKYFERLEQDINQYSTMENDTNDKNMVLQFKVGLSLSPGTEIPKQSHVNKCEDKLKKFQPFSNSTGDDSKHVRFSSSAVRIENKGSQPIEDVYAIPQISSSVESSMESFQKFKEKLFDRRLNRKFQNQLSIAKDFEISDLNSNSSQLSGDESHNPLLEGSDCEKNEIFQERILNLDKEIQSFREQNTELTNLIREHELIRVAFDQERHEANERMENERVNFNMYMHDERLKLLNERAEWEKNMKESRKLNRSEKDELICLREKCAKHEDELSSKEQKHVAAQARLRAQLKCIEKEFKELRFEVENLRRENKKLESENTRLRRESNSKILNEISKNISKLAKANGNVSNENLIVSEKVLDDEKGRSGVKKCCNKNAHKTVVAKVTSHRDSLKGAPMRSRSVPDIQKSIDEYLCDEISDCESSNSQNNECKLKSSYFSNDLEENHYSNIKIDKLTVKQCAQQDSGKSTKRVIENPDGSKDIWYSNGNLKKVSADGMCIRMLYFNKDIKETDIKEGTVKYYYAETNTWQTTYLDGLEIFEYPDGQTEHRFKNGVIEIHFPNGSVRITNPEREKNEGIKEEWKYADGTNVIQLTNSERILMLPNGQREVHANGHKRREYPDGTVKIVYPDGSQETRYSNGRVRLKNKEGKLIMDSETISI